MSAPGDVIPAQPHRAVAVGAAMSVVVTAVVFLRALTTYPSSRITTAPKAW